MTEPELKMAMGLCLKSLTVPAGESDATKRGAEKVKKSIGMINTRPLSEWVFNSLSNDELAAEIDHKRRLCTAAANVTSSPYIKWFFELVTNFFTVTTTDRVELVTVLRVFAALYSATSILLKRSERPLMKAQVGDVTQSAAATEIYTTVASAGTESTWYEATLCLSAGCSPAFVGSILGVLRAGRLEIKGMALGDVVTVTRELDLRNYQSDIREALRYVDFTTLKPDWAHSSRTALDPALPGDPDLSDVKANVVTEGDAIIYNRLMACFKP